MIGLFFVMFATVEYATLIATEVLINGRVPTHIEPIQPFMYGSIFTGALMVVAPAVGFDHILEGHFNRPLANSRSIFSITSDKLKGILMNIFRRARDFA